MNSKHLRYLKNAEKLPAIQVTKLKSGGYKLIDGFHRLTVYKKRECKTIKAVIHEYNTDKSGELKFELDRYFFNRAHGLPLKPKQRKEAILKLWSDWGKHGLKGKGLTQIKLAENFNLTAARINQIINGKPSDKVDGSKEVQSKVEQQPKSGPFEKFQLILMGFKKELESDSLKKLLSGDKAEEVIQDLKQVHSDLTEILQQNKNGAKKQNSKQQK